jgi:hypothetical protein
MSTDLVVYNQSVEEAPSSSVMTDKKWLQVLDQNNGSYSSGQSTLETTSLSTSDRFMNYREAYLSVPLVLSVANDTNVNTYGLENATNKSKLIGLKNSYTSIIHSFSCDLNGTNIIQNTPFTELYNAFQLMTSLSWDDVKTQGSTIGFYPDDALSASSFTANKPEGSIQATFNNQDLLTPNAETTAVLGNIGNKGFNERLKYINYDATGKVNGTADENTQSAYLLKASATKLYKNQVFNLVAGAVGASPIVQVQVMAVIKLRHLHNFFNHVPLCKGLQFRFIINFNQHTQTINNDATDITAEAVVKSQYGGICPFIVASGKANNGGSGTIRGAGGNIRADLSIGNKCLDSKIAEYNGATTSGLPQSISLWVPSYVMNPSLEASYISANSSKRISYTDIYNFRITGIEGGATFNTLITSGIRGVRSVVVMPMFPKSPNLVADVAKGNGHVQEFQSAQTCCGGGSTALLAQITNFNVQVGGVNQIQTNGRYEFEIFNNYVYGCNSVNGGHTDGLTSGLIGQADWGRKFLYYYVDCNRGTDLERDTPKSVQIQGENLSAKTVDYYVFIEFENSFSIDVGSGAIQA